MYFYFDDFNHIDTLSRIMFIKNSYIGVSLVVMLIYFVTASSFFTKMPSPKMIPTPFAFAETASSTPTNTSFFYQFKINGTLHESSSMSKSSSPYFWLNSGGILKLQDGVGKTNQGALGPLDYWRVLYAASNPLDTDGGKFPQNLFRLVTKSVWNNVEESVRFRITKLNMTDTPNRDGYSGVLLFSRYQDGNNLYYMGIRMDGTAVIKKKYQGTYYTLASGKVFSNGTAYNRTTNPNLIPINTWMGLKSTTKTQSNGDVAITLWIDKKGDGTWQQLLSATDTPGKYGSRVITGPAHAGIRTDYFDVEFDDYSLKQI